MIADNHAVVREGLKHILAMTADLCVAGEASSGGEASKMSMSGAWDIVVLEIAMPDSGGFNLLGQLKRNRPGLPVLVLSTLAEEQYGVHALRAGASGYVHKSASADELLKAIRKVAGGGRYISPALAEIMAQRLDGPSGRPPHETLSRRELEVFLSLATGKAPTEIARAMFLSVKTISTYRTRILEKLQLRTTAELAHYAIRCSLLPDLNPYRKDPATAFAECSQSSGAA